MRSLSFWPALVGLGLLLAACQMFAPAPIPALPDQAPVRSGPPTAPPAGAGLAPAQKPSDGAPSATTAARATLGVAPTSNGGGGEGDTLQIALSREPLSLDPGDLADPASLIVLRQLFDTLTQFKPGSAEIEAGVATAWEANADATEWTFTLRPGVKFHDGTALTAEAVKFNVDRWLDPAFKAGHRAEGKQFQVWSDVFGGYLGAGSLISGVEVAAPDQIRFKLARPAAYLPATLALPAFGLSSPAAVERLGARYGTPYEGVVGSGPYRLSGWTGEKVELERFTDYWGAKAATPRLIFRILGETDTQLTALASGQVDLAFGLTRPDTPPGVSLVAQPQLAVAYLSTNQRYRPLDDARVRQAIQAALDPAALAKRAFNGASSPADQFIPPGLWGRLPPAPSRGGARGEVSQRLLADAGFPKGLSEVAGPDGIARPLELWYSQPPRGASFKGLAEAVAEQLAAVGIKVTLREDEWASFLAERRQGQFSLYLLMHPLPTIRVDAVGDPHIFLSGLFGPLTASDTGYTNTQVGQRLREAESQPDMARRAELYREVGSRLALDAPRIPLVYPYGLAAMREGWTGFVPSPVGAEGLAGVRRKD
ncbi:MAG: hypothetical protein KIT87_13700 [Anaerolineae bacterium]|nr:hypothetical protein [Anaerolineae bacterium]